MTLSTTDWTPIAKKEPKRNKWDYCDEWDQQTIERERDHAGKLVTVQRRRPDGTWVLLARRVEPVAPSPRRPGGRALTAGMLRSR